MDVCLCVHVRVCERDGEGMGWRSCVCACVCMSVCMCVYECVHVCV